MHSYSRGRSLSVVCKCVDFHFFKCQQTKLLQQAALFSKYPGSTAYCVIGGAFEISKLKMGLAASNVNRSVGIKMFLYSIPQLEKSVVLGSMDMLQERTGRL